MSLVRVFMGHPHQRPLRLQVSIKRKWGSLGISIVAYDVIKNMYISRYSAGVFSFTEPMICVGGVCMYSPCLIQKYCAKCTRLCSVLGAAWLENALTAAKNDVECDCFSLLCSVRPHKPSYILCHRTSFQRTETLQSPFIVWMNDYPRMHHAVVAWMHQGFRYFLFMCIYA